MSIKNPPYYYIMFLLVLITVKFKQLVILDFFFFLTEADFGWAEWLLEYEYLPRESSGWHFYIKYLSCIPKSRWGWVCPLSIFYACASLAASTYVKRQTGVLKLIFINGL